MRKERKEIEGKEKKRGERRRVGEKERKKKEKRGEREREGEEKLRKRGKEGGRDREGRGKGEGKKKDSVTVLPVTNYAYHVHVDIMSIQNINLQIQKHLSHLCESFF